MKFSFLKPDFPKIVLFLILTVLLSLYEYDWVLHNTAVCLAIGFCPTMEEATEGAFLSIFPFVLVLSYILSCTALWAYRKYRK